MISSWGGMAPPKDVNMVKPIGRISQRPVRPVKEAASADLEVSTR
ncbi:hypothetical protein ACU686_28115 [Yinghuangia aomiensis]